jgi:ATP-dependent Lhr-like helicase
MGKGRKCEIIEVKFEKEMEIAVEFSTSKKKDYDIANILSVDVGSAIHIRKTKEIIEKNSASLVFVNTRDMGEILASRLYQLNTQVGIHHGSLSKNARIEAENRFKTGKTKALICTSSMELGIDVGKTDFVIQYNSPRQVTRLIQRIGRSGHSMGKISRGAIIATNPEDYAEAIVIARRALQGNLEETSIRKNPFTVLANQIISITVEYAKITDSRMYEILTRAYPFWELPQEKYNDLVNQLYQQGTIWYHQGTIKRKRKSMKYFLDNISMIPDEKTITVIDSSSNKKIGTLDESFVLNYCSEGTRFIMKGIPWEILEKTDEKIVVIPIKNLGIVPDWAGEDIPVPFEIAQEVGKLRRYLVNEKIPNDYPGKAGMKQFKKQVENQKNKGFHVPTDKVITIESGDNNVIINTHFGSKTNETVGRILSSLLSQKIGKNIALNTSPYRIILNSPKRINPHDIKDLFHQTDHQTLEHILRIVLPNSSLIKWHLFRVARKFGAVEKDATGKTISPLGLIRIFRKLTLFDEVIDKTLWDKMDILHAQEVWEKIQKNEIQLVFQAIAPISLSGEEIKKSYLSPHYGDKTILETLRKRLEKTRLLMICANCYHQWSSTVSRVRLKCPQCGGVMITGIKSMDEQKKFIKLLKKKVVEKKDKRELKRFLKSASLVASFGRDALFVLAGYGVGPDTAARILAKQKKEDELLWEILEAEITYARTKKFWD